ncbi:MAG: DEAD/DEAH box helicase [Christensenellaceae bacterium]|jgi:SNF2 family DNA or RNA helicase|nr:DEAD/DEAH box helicase [Christensenellaceae bacterium]
MNEVFDPFEELPEFSPALPAFLQEVPPSLRSYGELSFNKRAKRWVIKGEPILCQMAKRLFPGAEGRGRGQLRFPLGRRSAGDLNWLMLRYPMTVRAGDLARWEEALDAARAFALQKERARFAPQAIDPPAAFFKGRLMPFQREGAAYAVNCLRGLLADEMGLGKTVEALAAVAELQGYPLLLVAPPHLIRNWQREIVRFLQNEGEEEPTVHVVKGLKPYALPPAQIYIIHYLLLRGWKKELPQIPFKMVVFDEIQELRRAGTEKYSAASLLADACERVLGLSGTPIYNRGGEIWNVVNILDFHALGDFESFTREWCYGYGNNIVADPALLGQTLREEGLMLRRTKEQVLDQLPPKRRLVQEIDADDESFRALLEPALISLGNLRQAQTAFDRARLEDEICQRVRLATGAAKAPYVAAFVKALLEAGERVLLFAHHHLVMDAYKEALHGFSPRFITGRETTEQKDQSAQAFMEGKTNLCCISMRAAAGLNLQRASCVVFGELDWSPAVHSQAEDRAHRMGQRDSVLCYYLVSSAGSDSQMQEALGLKVSQFVGLMGDAPPSEEEALQMQVEAREHIRRVAEELLGLAEEGNGRGGSPLALPLG